jgi:selenocysteine-specific elongation factor
MVMADPVPPLVMKDGLTLLSPESDMREIVLGTAGHVDHGKTSLVRALTGIETDRLKEEKKRGITIELGFAFLDLPCGHRVGLVDVPGHEKFVKNMVAGAAGVDFIIFVIAADEGIMPQSTEHFEICRLLGIKQGIIVLTKIDMVEPDWLEMVEEEVRDYFSGTFLEEADLVKVSSVTGAGIDELKDRIDALVQDFTFAETYGPFRLPVDRVFSMKGFGSIVTGTSLSGRIQIGDDVELFPKGLRGKVRGIQSHGQTVEMVEAGKRTAINIQGIGQEDIERGNQLITPGCVEPSYMFDAEFMYLSSREKPLKNRTRVRVHLGSAEVMGRIVLLDDETLNPGDKTNVQILLEEPCGCWPNDRYVVRSYSPVATIGGGVIFGASPFKRKRFKEENRDAFKVYRQGENEEVFLMRLQESGVGGLTQHELGVKCGLFGKKLDKALTLPISGRKIIVVDSDARLMVSGDVFARLSGKIIDLLTGYHQQYPLRSGYDKEELRSKELGFLNPKIFRTVLASLVKQNLIVMEDAIVRLFDHRVVFQADESKTQEEILALYLAGGLKTPTIKEVYGAFPKLAHPFVKEMLMVLVAEQSMTKINEDLYFAATHLEKLQHDLVEFISREGEIDAPRFKELTGLSRKFSIPLLEYFDKQKITLRVGDKRILREKRG